jgi:hypothetical protein
MHGILQIFLHWLTAITDQVTAFLMSWLGHRIEAGLVAIVILVMSFALASYFSKSVDQPYRQLSGRKLKRVDDSERRLARLRRLRTHRWKFIGLLARSLVLFSIFAFVVPSAILVAGVYFYTWLLPYGGEALAEQVGCNVWSATRLTLPMLLEFTLAQFSMGFGHSLDLLVTNSRNLSIATGLSPTNGTVSAVLIGYRYFVAGFTGLFVRFLWRMIFVFWSVTPEEATLSAVS